ncbi:MAG: hypothetical protein QM757_42670 [Paludibaculum sp.]
MATLRDRAHRHSTQTIFARPEPWDGAEPRRHWRNYEMAYLILAGLSTPLVLSVHTIVSFDFAVSILPGLAHDDLPAVLRRGRHLLAASRWSSR